LYYPKKGYTEGGVLMLMKVNVHPTPDEFLEAEYAHLADGLYTDDTTCVEHFFIVRSHKVYRITFANPDDAKRLDNHPQQDLQKLELA
jgi:hypothetical protein